MDGLFVFGIVAMRLQCPFGEGVGDGDFHVARGILIEVFLPSVLRIGQKGMDKRLPADDRLHLFEGEMEEEGGLDLLEALC